jgi:hypothetical protein
MYLSHLQLGNKLFTLSSIKAWPLHVPHPTLFQLKPG